jgi:hypothetical protein
MRNLVDEDIHLNAHPVFARIILWIVKKFKPAESSKQPFCRFHSYPLRRRITGLCFSISETTDPMLDYSLLLSAFNNGFDEDTPALNLFNDTKLMSLEKRVFEIIDALETVVHGNPIGCDLMNAKEWKIAHERLFNRGELNDMELQTLFQTIAWLGLVRVGREIDWQKMKEWS